MRRLAVNWIVGLLSVLPAWAQVRVMSPSALVQQFQSTEGRIEGSTATFGAPFYGDRVLGRLVYGAPKGHAHCLRDDYQLPGVTSQPNDESVRLINIVLVRRGKCSFTTKVRVAFEKGAHAVIIVDRENSNLTRRELRNIIVADDGYGSAIRIPSILITRADGDKLIESVVNKEQVTVELAWDLPTNHVVRVDLWMSSGSAQSMHFLKEFSEKRKKLNEVVIFQPHYVVFGMDSGDPGVYSGLCIGDGAYCAEDPDGAGHIEGKDVLYEDVRQLCIHELYKRTRSSGSFFKPGDTDVEFAKEYWDYVEKFLERCPVEGNNGADASFGEQCSLKLMGEVNVDATKVKQCAASTRDSKLDQEKNFPAWSPRALRINGWRYSGVMDADLVTRAICSGFITQPKECTELLAPRDPFTPYAGSGPNPEAGIHFSTLLGWLLGTLLVGCGVLLLYRRYLRKQLQVSLREEVMLEVREQMGEYRRMQGL